MPGGLPWLLNVVCADEQLRGYEIIESSFESSFELLDFLFDEMTQGYRVRPFRVKDKVRVRVRIRSTFHRVGTRANMVLQISR